MMNKKERIIYLRNKEKFAVITRSGKRREFFTEQEAEDFVKGELKCQKQQINRYP